jgi:Protein of unknown function (DUF3987)
MTTTYQNAQLHSGKSAWPAARTVCDRYIGSASGAFRSELYMRAPAAYMAALTYVAMVFQGHAVVIDKKRRKIAPAFHGILLASPTMCNQVSQHLSGPHAEVEVEMGCEYVAEAARYKALGFSRMAQRKALQADLKLAADEAVRRSVLLARHIEHDLNEPQKQDFFDVTRKEAAKLARIALLKQVRAQARSAGDIALVKMYDKQLPAARREEVLNHATAHDRWQSQRNLIVSEIGRLDGAAEREEALRRALADHIANQPKAPVVPKLVYMNTPVSSIMKSHSQSLSAAAIFSGSSALKSLRKQREGIVELLATARRPISVFCAAPFAEVTRDLKALGVEDAMWMSMFHVVTDAREPEPVFLSDDEPEPVQMSELDDWVKKDIRKKFSSNFEISEITLSREAEMLKANTCEKLRALCVNQALNPIFEAYLSRMPITLSAIAGLLYLVARKTGPLPVDVMQDAIVICEWLADEFERAVVPAPEMPPEVGHAWTLRHALYGCVDKKQQLGEPTPFVIALSTLCNKSASIGLSKAQIRRAVSVMRDLGWVRIQADGLDQMIEMDPHLFSQMNRHYGPASVQ